MTSHPTYADSVDASGIRLSGSYIFNGDTIRTFFRRTPHPLLQENTEYAFLESLSHAWNSVKREKYQKKTSSGDSIEARG
jgi:hypothetical protein